MAQVRVRRDTLARMLRSHGEDDLADRAGACKLGLCVVFRATSQSSAWCDRIDSAFGVEA